MKNQKIYTYAGRVTRSDKVKGDDVALAIDLVYLAFEKAYEVGIIVSQDTDYIPAVNLAKKIAADQGRNISFESWFAFGPGSKHSRGIPGTQWHRIDRQVYDQCIDQNDYRPAKNLSI